MLYIKLAEFSIVIKIVLLLLAELTGILLQVAIKLVPDSKTFMDLLKERDENFDSLKKQMQILVSLLVPFLEDAHCILVSLFRASKHNIYPSRSFNFLSSYLINIILQKVYNLDRIKST